MIKILALIVLVLLLIFGLWKLNTRSQLVKITAPIAENFPENSFSHHNFEQLLQRFVDHNGNINYQAWHDSKTARYQLQQYLAAVAAYSPQNSPSRFASEQDQLAYWIYSYNAIVIQLILSNWPIKSVTDLKAPVEVIKGLGFFYNQTFVVGGETLNLYQLEQQKLLKTNADARLHFVLNCGSASCPPIQPQLPVGANLSILLEQASGDFINDEKNVRFDEASKQLKLSSLFKWYSDDFSQFALNHYYHGTKPLSKEQALLVFIDHFYQGDLIKQHANAPVSFIDYDWALNNSTNINRANNANARSDHSLKRTTKKADHEH